MAIGTVLVLIPFQTVATRYGTSSVLVAYALAVVLLIERWAEGPHAAVAGTDRPGVPGQSVAGRSGADVPARDLHLSVLLMSGRVPAGVQLRSGGGVRAVESSTCCFWSTCWSIIYCFLQLSAGPGQELRAVRHRCAHLQQEPHEGDARLIGPFDNPGSTAGYFTIMILVCVVDLMAARGGRRRLVQGLAVLNLVGIGATGNRTGLLVLAAMFPVLLFAFRKQLGVAQGLAVHSQRPGRVRYRLGGRRHLHGLRDHVPAHGGGN